MSNKVWFVTGASKGLGLVLVKQLLAQGNFVAATSRNQSDLAKAVGENPHFLPLATDLNNEADVKQAVRDTLAAFGRIDTVVNNAGFGQSGTLEELSDEESRRNFDVNVFGMLNVIRAVMPHLRAQKSGHIMNISSMAGIQGYIPGWGVYCAAKFAVAGLTEALAAEAKPFGIKVTLVYPGHLRTSFLSGGSIMLPDNPIADYVEVRNGEKAALEQFDGQQEGDPEKAAALLIKADAHEHAPLHLFMGEDVYHAAHRKLDSVKKDLEAWKQDSLAVKFSQTP